MTDQELLAMAISFEVLPYRRKFQTLPFIERITVTKTNLPEHPESWCIASEVGNLAKDGYWEWAPLPSNRDEEFYGRCRWPSAKEAIEFAKNHLANYPNGYKPEPEDEIDE